MSHPVAIAHDNVRPTARGERPDRPAGRLGAPGQGPFVKRASGRLHLPLRPARCGRGARGAGCTRAAGARPAAVISTFESEPDAEAPAGRQEVAARGKMPSPRLASVIGQRPATAPRRRCRAISVASSASRGSRHQRASTGALVEQPRDRALRRDQARQSSTSFTCSATWMCIGPSGPAARSRASSSGVTARRLCGAMPTTASSRPATALRAPSTSARSLDIVDEAPLPLVGRRAAEAALRVEDRQQRQPDAGLRGRRGDARGQLGRVAHRAGRRRRDAGSGTRRRGEARLPASPS